jgi:Uma2 family endonuclease
VAYANLAVVGHAARQRFDFVEYVMLEEMAAVKHEYLDGNVWAMAGGSPEHARVQVNVSALLSRQLAGRPCSVYSSDLRIRVKATGLGTYPDVTVVCGALELDPEDPKQHTVVNPSLVVEVLSPSTEDYDRGEKLDQLKRIESLNGVVLVAHDERRVEVWTREGDSWIVRTYRDDDVAWIHPLGCELPLPAVYRDPFHP